MDGFFTLSIILHCGRLVAHYPRCFGLLTVVALIPLSEFSDPLIAKKYGAKPDAETLDILNTVAKEKEVITQRLVCFLSSPPCWCLVY
jgi:hypothetical protein